MDTDKKKADKSAAAEDSKTATSAGPDTSASQVAPRDDLDISSSLSQGSESLTGGRKKAFTSYGKSYAGAVAVKERSADLILEITNSSTDGRLLHR